MPWHVQHATEMLSTLWGVSTDEVNLTRHNNLRRLVTSSMLIDKSPS